MVVKANGQESASHEEEFDAPNDSFTDTNISTASEETTFEDEVNTVVSKMVQNDKGVWELPDDLKDSVDDKVLFAARSEKRYRDTQSAYTKSRQKLKEIETVNDKLTEHLVDNVTLHLTQEQRDELDDLKSSDPDAWRAKLNEHETESKRILQEKLDGFKQEGKKMSALEIRQAKMEAFSESTGVELTDEIVENELPAKLSKDLEKGTIDFDEFLEKAYAFLTKDKVIEGADDEPEPKRKSLNKFPGKGTPSEKAQVGDIIQSYKTEIY